MWPCCPRSIPHRTGAGRGSRSTVSPTDGRWTIWPGGPLPTRPGTPRCPTLAAAALTTSRLWLGTFVASPNFRHPVPFAKELMTLDVMSAGRMLVGVGAGGPGFDAAVLGGRRCRDASARTGSRSSSRCSTCCFGNPRPPGPATGSRRSRRGPFPDRVQQPRPPLVVAGNGPRGIRLALRIGDGWATNGVAEPPGAGQGGEEWWRGVAEAARRLDAAAGTRGNAGRVPPGPRHGLRDGRSPVAGADAGPPRPRGGAGLHRRVIAWPRDSEPLRGSTAVLERAGRSPRGRQPRPVVVMPRPC